ncbi:MAG: GtrA family protein [Opitutales bacterium]|nr:GtrA family protein [Opitutales bacterium]
MRLLFAKFCHSTCQRVQFLRFASVGMTIALFDIVGVYLLPHLFGMELYVARVISLSTSMFIGYLLNRYFTFKKDCRGNFFRQLGAHYGVHLSGGVINYGIFALLIEIGQRTIESTVFLNCLPLTALWIGGLSGMLFNFLMSKKFVFSISPKPSTLKIPVFSRIPNAEK